MGSNYKAIFVGDTPSKHNTDASVAFVGAKCYPRLLSWLDVVLKEGDEYMLINRTDKDFQLWVYLAHFKGTPIIALGQKASKAIPYKHFALPHPSGLNRQNNDLAYIKRQLRAAKRYIAFK